jgi:hypothetical protein
MHQICITAALEIGTKSVDQILVHDHVAYTSTVPVRAW